jgi:hypothetical protein
VSNKWITLPSKGATTIPLLGSIATPSLGIF